MKRKKTEKELIQDEKVKNWFAAIGLGFIIFTLVFASVESVFADQITHKFKNPSFSGVGTSSHYLTIENQEFSRKLSLKEELKALQDEIERDKENTTLARFVRNLESRIYAQLSRQLVENLFGDVTKTSGTLELENNLISYTSDGVTITLTITDPDGNTTEISLPIGSFTF
tara:strand:- start:175 stop:687 length:513 start_codon:yes stop_codon:yes gene_type:complete